MAKAFLIFVLCCVVVISSHEGHYHESCDETGEGCHIHHHECDGHDHNHDHFHDHFHDHDHDHNHDHDHIHVNNQRLLLTKGKGSSCKADRDCDRGLACKRNRCSI